MLLIKNLIRHNCFICTIIDSEDFVTVSVFSYSLISIIILLKSGVDIFQILLISMNVMERFTTIREQKEMMMKDCFMISAWRTRNQQLDYDHQVIIGQVKLQEHKVLQLRKHV